MSIQKKVRAKKRKDIRKMRKKQREGRVRRPELSGTLLEERRKKEKENKILIALIFLVLCILSLYFTLFFWTKIELIGNSPGRKIGLWVSFLALVLSFSFIFLFVWKIRSANNFLFSISCATFMFFVSNYFFRTLLEERELARSCLTSVGVIYNKIDIKNEKRGLKIAAFYKTHYNETERGYFHISRSAYNRLSIGDTILIRYTKKNPTYVPRIENTSPSSDEIREVENKRKELMDKMIQKTTNS